MAVDALQLRPRHTLALFDASLRAVAGSSGLWVLLLPPAALTVFAFLRVTEAIERGRPLTGPAALLTAAFAARCLAQGAASHFLEQQILSQTEPTVRGSLAAGWRRFPGLIVAGTLQLVIDLCLLFFTFGIGFFFVGAHQAIFPAAMRGEGGALSLYGTASRLLGGARSSAPFVRACNALQLLLALNLHIAANFGVLLGKQLLALDLNFLDRFMSIDNGVWVLSVFVIAFVLFEPVRAAVGVLLVIDGRVRQEGLDLIAQVEQLPRRKRPKAPLAALTAFVLALGLPALADAPVESTALRQRAERLVDECEMEPRIGPEQVRLLDQVGERDQSALARFISRVERRAYDDQDCDAAERDLREGLLEVEATRGWSSSVAARAAREDAARILARPEFEPVEPRKKEEPEDEKAPDGPWQAFWDEVGKWIKRFFEWLLERESTRPIQPPDFAGGELFGANVVMLVVVVLLLGLLVFLGVQLLPKKQAEAEAGEALGAGETPLAVDPMSALSKRPETWAGLADELAARGAYREAIRHLYLALLSTLHRAGAIDYDPTKSNWDYLLDFKGGGAQKSAFRELTRRFDFAWYGNLEVSGGAYGAFRRIVQPLLSQPEPKRDA